VAIFFSNFLYNLKGLYHKYGICHPEPVEGLS